MRKEIRSLYKLKARLETDFETAAEAMVEKKALDHVANLIAILEWQHSQSGADPDKDANVIHIHRKNTGSGIESRIHVKPNLRHQLSSVRGLSLSAVTRMTEDEAREAFARIRWHKHNGKPFCGRCGCTELYACKAEDRWKCKDCGYRFSVTSGTIFASHKLPLRDLLAAIVIFMNAGKEYSALQFSRDLDVQYKTAFYLSKKIKEAVST